MLTAPPRLDTTPPAPVATLPIRLVGWGVPDPPPLPPLPVPLPPPLPLPLPEPLPPLPLPPVPVIPPPEPLPVPVPLPLPLLPLPPVPLLPLLPEVPEPLLDPLPAGPTDVPPDDVRTEPDPLHAANERADAAIKLAKRVCLRKLPEDTFRMIHHSMKLRVPAKALRRRDAPVNGNIYPPTGSCMPVTRVALWTPVADCLNAYMSGIGQLHAADTQVNKLCRICAEWCCVA